MRTKAMPWAIALLALGMAVLLRWVLDPLMRDTLPLVTLFGAVAIGVWLGGYRVGGVVATLGYFACAYLFIEPRGTFGFGDQAILAAPPRSLFDQTAQVNGNVTCHGSRFRALA